VLTVTDGTIVSTIKLTGDYTQANFALGMDSGGHTLVTYNGTGMAAIPASGSVNRMAAAMAAMGGGTAASSLASSTAQNPTSLLLATPHAS